MLLTNFMTRFVREDHGQDIIEYGLLLGVITVAALVAIRAIGPNIGTRFTNLNGGMP